MGQIGFFDLSKRYTGLDAKNEPLAKIDEVVPWEDFRGCLDAVCRRSDKARKSRAGRKPWDAVVMFKTIILWSNPGPGFFGTICLSNFRLTIFAVTLMNAWADHRRIYTLSSGSCFCSSCTI